MTMVRLTISPRAWTPRWPEAMRTASAPMRAVPQWNATTANVSACRRSCGSSNRFSTHRQRVEGDRQAELVALERLHAMPHVGRKEHELARLGLHALLCRKRRLGNDARLAEAQPSGMPSLRLHHRRHRNVEGRRDPAALMHVIGVIAARGKAHAPRAGQRK